jgi:isocitrate dehydrogenase kinase/phosphatase
MTALDTAGRGAASLERSFDRFQYEFRRVTRRALTRFEDRDWAGMQQDATDRLDVYSGRVGASVTELRRLVGARLEDRSLWSAMREAYSALIAQRDDWELAETYFNSVTRRVFTTVGVDPAVEFVSSDFDFPPTGQAREVYHRYGRADTTAELVEAILTDFRFGVLYRDIRGDAQRAAALIDRHLEAAGLQTRLGRAEVVKQPFFMGDGAYLVGRLEFPEMVVPLVLALRNEDGGVVVDAVLLDEDDVSILFSFTRSYFHVDVERPYDLVGFLRSIMPRKPVAELYRSIGYHKHGKTEQYRELLTFLAGSNDPFTAAPGVPGLVMVVFTMEGYDFVFKVMRDVFGAPKQIPRSRVRERYQLVFHHDRAGRLIDAQEFEHLQFDRRRFRPELLDELVTACSRLVRLEGDRVVIDHAYVERRVEPLDLYVRRTDDTPAADAVIDYGRAIRDLAATNIFPGDMLLKNFGVTRHRRVVFYDYDELALLTDCRFRRLPVATHPDDEMGDEPWFGVDDADIFPEEFRRFLGLPAELRRVFEDHHGDLFDVGFWLGMQQRLAGGEVISIIPYSPRCRLGDQLVPNAPGSGGGGRGTVGQ